MSGEGNGEAISRTTSYYSGHIDGLLTGMQATNANSWQYVENAIDMVQLDNMETFVICEYGAANGLGSFDVFTKIIRKIRKKCGSDKEVMIIYGDLESNNFNGLFRAIKEERDASPDFHGVFTMATAKSFYDQCAPSNSVHFGYSASSMHWLSATPCHIEDIPNAWTTTSEEIQNKYKLHAANDWETLLLSRAKELAKGGHLMLEFGGRTEANEYSGCTFNIPTNFSILINQLFHGMHKEGIISKNEFIHTTKHWYARSREEVTEPFRDPNSPVFKSGLRLLNIEIKINRCPFNTQWIDGTMQGKPLQDSVKEYVRYIRSWNEHTWYGGLSNTRKLEEKHAIVDELYSRYEAVILEKPRDHGCDVVACYVHMMKE